jgi:hypothetical protein
MDAELFEMTERIVGEYKVAEERLLDIVCDEFFDPSMKRGSPEEAAWRARLDTIATVSPELAEQIEWYGSRLMKLQMLTQAVAPKPATAAPDEHQ